MRPVANARMYSVAPGAALAWRRLLGHAIAQAGIAMDVVDHPLPAGLPELWARPDLGCAFMCGWPFAQEGAVRPIVAAPVPARGDGAVYRAVFVVAADGPFRTLEDVLGRRFAFNARHSHSGWNLPRAHLAAIGAPPFAELVGPFVTHQASIAAVASGRADVAGMDGYVLELLRRHDPSLAASVRVVAETAASPIPLFVGARWGDPLGEASRAKLLAALIALETEPGGRALLDAVGLRGFAAVDASAYAATLVTERAAAGFVDAMAETLQAP